MLATGKICWNLAFLVGYFVYVQTLIYMKIVVYRENNSTNIYNLYKKIHKHLKLLKEKLINIRNLVFFIVRVSVTDHP